MELPNSKIDVPCLFPFHIDNPAFPAASRERYLPVPCGKCPPCVQRRANGWIFRLLQQDKVSNTAAFVTLTYDTTHVPISKRGFMTLCKRDFQLFMKRLRKLHPKDSKLKYYAVGEYGSKTFRPHYHAIIFDLDKNLVPDAWTLGDVHIGDVSGASVAYTTKYLSKGKIIPVHSNDDRVPEFSLMSKKLGINYLSDAVIKYHQADISRNYVMLEGGVKIAMPRYFREKIYTDEQRKEQGHLIAKISQAAQAEKEAAHAQRTGTPDTFIRDEFASKAQEIKTMRERAKNNRKTI